MVALVDLSNQLGKLGEGLAAQAGLTTQQWLVLLQGAFLLHALRVYPGCAAASVAASPCR